MLYSGREVHNVWADMKDEGRLQIGVQIKKRASSVCKVANGLKPAWL